MKKLFSFISVFALAAILGVSSVSAQKTVVTMEKLWSKTIADMGVTTADTRQGTGLDGKVYLLNKANQSLVAISAEGKDTICVGPLTVSEGVTAKLDGTAYALDDAGNFVMVGTFPNVPSHIVLRKADGSVVKDLAITGLARTDFINATGDVFSAEGGYVFVYGNGKELLVYKVAEGALVGNPTTVAVAGVGGGNYVIAGDDKVQIAHHRSSQDGWMKIENGVETLIEGMEGFKKTTMGGDIITLAGKEFYIYPTGQTDYTSQFSVRNMTDGAFVVDKADGQTTIFCANTLDKNPGATSTACWLNVSKTDDNNAYVHVYNAADGAAVYKLSVVVAATITLNVNDAAMGTVEGAGDAAVGGNATIKAIPALGHSFVCWMNGTDTVATTAEYTFKVEKDVTLTAHFQKEADVKLTLAVNDASKGSITLPEGIVMGENTVAYGTKVVLTAVPVEGATFMGWYNADKLYAEGATTEVAVTADLALTANFMSVLKLEYDLGGGVTNEYGWLSKADMYYALNADLNAYAKINETWLAYEAQLGIGKTNASIPTYVGTAAERDKFLAMFSDTAYVAKWGWLAKYLEEVAATQYYKMDPAQGVKTVPTSASGTFTFSIANFFGGDNNHIADYLDAVDFSGAESALAAYRPTWKHSYANPTEVTGEFVLNEPYHPELTFYGWYTNAEFTGDKVTTVSPTSVIPGGKLYAKFDEYIPTIAEVMAMPEGTETKVSGVVNWVRNNNVFIQDATGGFLLYGSDLAPEVGTKIIAKGKRGAFNGSPQLSNTVIESSEKAELYAPVLTDLATLCADTTALKNFGKRVQVLGVRVAEYDSNGNIYVTDGTNKVKGHYMVPDQTVFAVGKKVDIVAVASQYKGTVQFEGDVKGITLTVLGKKDTYAYPTRGENNQYKLENRWVISNVEDNFAANAPGGDQKVRGMAAKDGIMYFINQAGYIVRVDGASGDMLEPLTITGDHLFEVQGEDGAWASAVTYGFNDIKFDSEGHCLITGLPTSSAQRFMVYEVDLETGAATEIINERLADNPDFEGVTARFDAMGVNGDVHGNACIMAACAGGGLDVVRWLIEDGVAQPGELISMLFNAETDDYLYESITGWGTAPQIFPQDEVGSLFYVDGNTATPMLIDENGMLIEDLKKCPAGVDVWNNPGDTVSLQPDLCGLQEFQIGDEYFFIMIATHNVNNKKKEAPQAFALYKFKDEARSFDGLEPLWYFPAKGLGSASNGVRTAVPTVEVRGNKATIYLYAQNNGYAVYEFVNTDLPEGVENVETETFTATKFIENGQVFIIKNGVKYNVLGVTVK